MRPPLSEHHFIVVSFTSFDLKSEQQRNLGYMPCLIWQDKTPNGGKVDGYSA